MGLPGVPGVRVGLEALLLEPKPIVGERGAASLVIPEALAVQALVCPPKPGGFVAVIGDGMKRKDLGIDGRRLEHAEAWRGGPRREHLA